MAHALLARQQRFIDLRDRRTSHDPEALRSLPSPGFIPEIGPDRLDPGLVRRAVAESGAIIVRGLFTPDVARQLRADVEHVLQACEQEASHEGAGQPWYEPFRGRGPTPELDLSRTIATLGNMGALMVDSAHFTEQYLARLDSLGVLDLVERFLGAPPMLSAEKAVLRRVPPETGTSWHQDGAFLGADVRALNLWVALSDCGTDAPGLDLVARRPDRILATGTDGAQFDWSVSETVVDEWRGRLDVVHPEFQAGDAVLFDHMNVHRTGVRPGMTASRYAVECWFFSPWHMPAGYTGIAAQSTDA